MFSKKFLIIFGIIVIGMPICAGIWLNSLSPEQQQRLSENYQKAVEQRAENLKLQEQTEQKHQYNEPDVCDIHGQIANVIIEGYTRYPSEARKPRCYEATLEKNPDNTYTMTGFVYAKNAFGVEGRLGYSVKLRFSGGNPADISNWKNIGEPIITEF